MYSRKKRIWGGRERQGRTGRLYNVLSHFERLECCRVTGLVIVTCESKAAVHPQGRHHTGKDPGPIWLLGNCSV